MKNYISQNTGEIRMYAKIKHNKIRNTGLLFEFLLRQITSDVLDKVQKSSAMQIVKQRFNERTELGKELALYNILINKKFNSDKKANYFISQVLSERQKINNAKKKGTILRIRDVFNIRFETEKIKFI